MEECSRMPLKTNRWGTYFQLVSGEGSILTHANGGVGLKVEAVLRHLHSFACLCCPAEPVGRNLEKDQNLQWTIPHPRPQYLSPKASVSESMADDLALLLVPGIWKRISDFTGFLQGWSDAEKNVQTHLLLWRLKAILVTLQGPELCLPVEYLPASLYSK